MKNVYFQFWILVILNMIDIYFSYLMIQSGGVEINPLIVYSMNSFGIVGGMLLVKVPILMLIGLMIYAHKFNGWFTKGKWLSCDFPRVLNIGIVIYLGIDVYTFILLHL